ncbi:vacuolar protein sorting-associated protein, putative [Entamoeba invadens IP1]|uniref:Vacuolar protein sorting-associated protein 29 n=1 Tax=Entamoeba invadens IP1 TaxID=370355 RepID=A0A0A1U9T7_ENTIV|nr:vacuolar protein sorting-associated protein, putative [Entamoeba invadens IP1]ELP88890.1 vacuolar protein sorting-associated protein, putative [Entamoeba invadens IP1]|eukprot:XP_004255661.1 vacuolar protein sorting-associated protein, putative [Entamoeba invadens IP1]
MIKIIFWLNLKFYVIGDFHIPHRTAAIPQLFLNRLNTGRIKSVLCTGNLCGKETYDILRTLARDVHAVKGDFDEMPGLNETEVIKIGNFKIGLIHGHQIIPWGDKEALAIYQRQLDVDILISGHTHQLKSEQIGGKFFLNPGSATGAYSPLISNPVPSFMLLEINDSELSIYEYTLKDGVVDCELVKFNKDGEEKVKAEPETQQDKPVE